MVVVGVCDSLLWLLVLLLLLLVPLLCVMVRCAVALVAPMVHCIASAIYF
jgi:hypothetical protein